MTDSEPIWLVFNRASGSNDEAALAEVEEGLQAAALRIAGRTYFPQDKVPTASELDDGGISTLRVFAGDGTIHSLVISLFGWQGRAIVLPGGTMNLLSKELHGEAGAVEILGRIAAGPVRLVRPPILEGRTGHALTSVLSGPGTAWNDVREALRNAELGGFAAAAASALVESVAGEKVICRSIEGVRVEGYAAISLELREDRLEVLVYYAEVPGDFLGQLAALLQRNFRKGPHEKPGPFDQAAIETINSEPMGLLMDGEPCDAQARETFVIASCPVDLVATHNDA
ncbi:MAG: diacylglycerol kinase [Alphaproteobacteria bacterium]|nr:diacylglycerol kinase [Alphaproteobacteria bacterium]